MKKIINNINFNINNKRMPTEKTVDTLTEMEQSFLLNCRHCNDGSCFALFV